VKYHSRSLAHLSEFEAKAVHVILLHISWEIETRPIVDNTSINHFLSIGKTHTHQWSQQQRTFFLSFANLNPILNLITIGTISVKFLSRKPTFRQVSFIISMLNTNESCNTTTKCIPVHSEWIYWQVDPQWIHWSTQMETNEVQWIHWSTQERLVNCAHIL
jgi:hypothetical protein